MNERKNNRERDSKVNLILLHVNHTFCIFNPKPFNTHCTIRKNGFFNAKKGPIQGSNWPTHGPLSKVALIEREKL